MDRVLIATDNMQFSGHLTNTLRKVGYDTETLQNEFNLADRILTFNPDVIIVRGNTSRLSSLNVGKKIKELQRFTGKVILIFGRHDEPSEIEKKQIRSDINLTEPASVLKITATVLNFEATDKNTMIEKLFKMAADDISFRTEEQSYLVKYGITLEHEMIQVRSLSQGSIDLDLTHIKSKIKLELVEHATKEKSRIEIYNQLINKIDIDLKKGLNKRQAKAENKLNRKEWNIPEKNEPSDLDNLRKDFAKELFNKNK